MKKKLKKILVILTVCAVIVSAAVLGYHAEETLRINKIVKTHADYASQSSTENGEASVSAENMQVTSAVQQIMIGSLCSSYDNALSTLKDIKAAGYDAIELNDFMIHKTSLSVKLMTQFAGMPIGNGGTLDWPKLIKESGLRVISLHSDLGSIEKDPAAVADEAKSFGTDIVVITGMYQFDYGSESAVADLAARLNAAGKELSKEGVRLLYHNHNCELQHVNDTQTAYDLILAETDPSYVNFEFDSYWMTEGGANVPAIMQELGKRMVLWHINDRGCTKKGPYMTPILSENETELGYGNIDLDTLSEIAIQNGMEGVVLETHENWVDDDPIESFIKSAAYIQKTF